MTARVSAALVATLPAAIAGASPPVLQLVNNPDLGAYVDLSRFDPQPLNLANDQEVELGTFSGNFVLQPGMVVVGQNGGVAFNQMTVADLAAVNEPIPSQNAFLGGQATLVYWDDIDDKDGDTLFADIVGDPKLGDRLVIQWTFGNFDGAGSTLGMQLHVLHNNQPSGIYAQFAYTIDGPALGAGASATIGHQAGGSEFDDLQFSFNTANVIFDGTVLSLMIPQPGDLDADGQIGITDFLMLLGQWGPCPDCVDCAADIDGDCDVGLEDFLYLIGSWG